MAPTEPTAEDARKAAADDPKDNNTFDLALGNYTSHKVLRLMSSNGFVIGINR